MIMLSSFSSYDDELLNSAYANISLIADRTWVFNSEDLYRNLNQSLWIQSCKLIEKYKNDDGFCPKRVRDVIPESRLSKYGNYEYNEEREKIYRPDDDVSSASTLRFYAEEITEAWMLPEVEDYFARLISGSARQPDPKLSALKELQSDGDSLREYVARQSFKANWNDVLQNTDSGQKLSPNAKKRLRKHGEPFSIYKSSNTDIAGKNSELDEYNKYRPPRYSIDNPTELQLQACISCEIVRDLWNPTKVQQLYATPDTRLQYQQRSLQQPQCNRQEQRVNSVAEGQQQLYCAIQYQPLALKVDYQSRLQADTYEIMRKPLPPNLSPEVPEFFPKCPVACLNSHKEQRVNPVQYFPSLNEKSYQKELFPYNRTYETVVVTSFQNVPIPMLPSMDTSHYMRTPHQWIQRVSTPGQIHIPVSSSTQPPVYASLQATRTSVINQRPQQVNPTPIPVYQRPLELYTDHTQIRKNTQGVDFNNLILLTKNAMKVRRNTSRNPQQSKQSNQKTEENVFQWLDKGASKKSKDLISMNTLVTEVQNFEEKCDYGKIVPGWKPNEAATQQQIAERLKSSARTIVENANTAISSNETDIEVDTHNKKRLYRDVLTNTSSASTMLDNIYEKRYDELEQQAMEQYRTSEESLALKYQELERQAMEQYRCPSSMQDNVCNPSVSTNDKLPDETVPDVDEKKCSDGQRCSTSGKCSPMRQAQGKSQKGSFQQPQITLLRPKTKSEGNIARRSSGPKAIRPTIVSKSFTTLTHKISQGSKNTSKGASGDRADKNNQKSSKRRLILVLPFKHKSEARLVETTHEEMYCLSQPKRRSLEYYDNSNIFQTNGDDKNMTIIQSPNTEVWLSGFWTA
ncbi:hypothetical protein KPH14_004494 [Odynerus spinipes]|uniref:Uncharacterized protein n=1 Tax=Odynerus spinipes TaxID=1348599 RepID=A0AAD9RLV0_9HYME|nr:hypothetical protein KPH14_004494 [Odynerus spinipes]